MNDHAPIETDAGAMAREWWLSLGPAERLRWLDARVDECGGGLAPIPAFEDTKGDAEHWCAMCLAEVLKIYMAAIWEHLSERDRASFLRWAGKREARKAEAPGG